MILHVPHAATAIPADVRAGIVLDDLALDLELLRSTDAYTDEVALGAADMAALRPWCFVNRLSRLVVDPERFPDERERMRSVGRGAVYTRTSDGGLLRQPTEATERQLIQRFFEPYAQSMEELVAERLKDAGRAVIIDVHSYPSSPMAYELRASQTRPQLCLGVDAFHSPAALVEAARRAFDGRLEKLGVNQPYAGAYVPLRWFGKEPRVEAIMLEVRRDAYMNEATGALISLGQVTAGYVSLIDSVA